MNANTALATLTTEGFINDFTADTLAALTSLDIGHTYTTDFTRPFNFVVNDVDLITSLDLSSLNKVFNLFITNNAVLSDITAPANTIAITPDTLKWYNSKYYGFKQQYSGYLHCCPSYCSKVMALILKLILCLRLLKVLL